MRNTLILSAAFAAVAGAALAQSSPPQPVMPPEREYVNPNADMAPPKTGVVPEGRAAAPMEHTAPNRNRQAPARSGANGS